MTTMMGSKAPVTASEGGMAARMDVALSVILITPDDYGTIRDVVLCLRDQGGADRLELVIVAPDRATLALDERDLSGFGDWQVVEVGPIVTIGAAKLTAIRRATAPIVAFGEDHSFPEPGWAEAILAALAQGHVAAGPAVRCGNPRTLLSWANYLMHFGAWAPEAVTAGSVTQLPWHNTSYRRDLLLAFGDRLPSLLAAEARLQQELQDQGHSLYLAADAVTAHVNVSRWLPSLRGSFWGGRLYGSTRAQDAGWPVWKRIVYAGGSPLVPLIRVRRLRQTIGRAGQRRLIPGIFATLIPLLMAHAAGEAVGYLIGIGAAEERYSFFEMRRIDHLCAADRAEFGRT